MDIPEIRDMRFMVCAGSCCMALITCCVPYASNPPDKLMCMPVHPSIADWREGKLFISPWW